MLCFPQAHEARRLDHEATAGRDVPRLAHADGARLPIALREGVKLLCLFLFFSHTPPLSGLRPINTRVLSEEVILLLLLLLFLFLSAKLARVLLLLLSLLLLFFL